MIESILSISLAASLNAVFLLPEVDDGVLQISETSSTLTNELLLAQADVPVVEEKGFAFEYTGCTTYAGADSPLTCEFLVENRNRSEKKLAIYGYASRRSHSRMIDGRGNEILATSAQLGRAVSDRAAEVDMLEGIPLKASVTFEAAPEDAIIVIDLGCYLYGNGGGSFNVEFRFAR